MQRLGYPRWFQPTSTEVLHVGPAELEVVLVGAEPGELGTLEEDAMIGVVVMAMTAAVVVATL